MNVKEKNEPERGRERKRKRKSEELKKGAKQTSERVQRQYVKKARTKNTLLGEGGGWTLRRMCMHC